MIYPSLLDIFNEKRSKIHIYDCYDGDTCKGYVLIPNTKVKVSITIRMKGYDSPELRTKDVNEKRIGRLSRDKLREQILNKDLYFIAYGGDKYGRIIAELEQEDGKSVNSFMIDNNLGHPYTGGTKSKVTYKDSNTFIREGKEYTINI